MPESPFCQCGHRLSWHAKLGKHSLTGCERCECEAFRFKPIDFTRKLEMPGIIRQKSIQNSYKKRRRET